MNTSATLKEDRLRQFREASRRWYADPSNKLKKAEYDRARPKRKRGPRKRSVRSNRTPRPKRARLTEEERRQRASEYRTRWMSIPGNRERAYASHKVWKLRPENQGYDVKLQLERRRNDPAYRMCCNLRNSLRRHVREASQSKSGSSRSLIGCTVQELRQHIAANFLPGMTWDNYGREGGWHVDHVIPCASFDMSDPAQQRACFHWSNLQPLWAADNILKGDRLPDGTLGRHAKPQLSTPLLEPS